MQPKAKATTSKNYFSRETTVSVDIAAEPRVVWNLLTNAADFPRWNSTIVSIDGQIKPGEKIRLATVLSPGRVFKLSVKTFEPESKLAWGDAMGTRTYTINRTGEGRTNFTMTERIGGPVFPLFARMIPSFDESFETFAEDLKREAETFTNNR